MLKPEPHNADNKNVMGDSMKRIIARQVVRWAFLALLVAPTVGPMRYVHPHHAAPAPAPAASLTGCDALRATLAPGLTMDCK